MFLVSKSRSKLQGQLQKSRLKKRFLSFLFNFQLRVYVLVKSGNPLSLTSTHQLNRKLIFSTSVLLLQKMKVS